jgi:hypothetical protein
LEAGICLRGPVGSSKSTVMEAFQDALHKSSHSLHFSILRTAELREDFEKAGKSKDKSPMSVITALGRKDTYYDEIGLPIIPIVSIYGKDYNLDHHLIEHFEGKPRRSGYLLHTSTNLSDEVLKQYLGARNYSRFRQLCNVIDVASDIDYRLKTRHKRRDMQTEETLKAAAEQAKAENMKKVNAMSKLAAQFMAEVNIYYDTNSYQVGNETAIYDLLIDIGLIKDKMDDKVRMMIEPEATERAAQIIAARRLQAIGDRKEVNRLNEILEQLRPGMARTTTVQGLIAIEVKKIRLRQFVDFFEDYAAFEKVMVD